MSAAGPDAETYEPPWVYEYRRAPLAQRLRQSAETIEEINARDGLGLNCTVSPLYLRTEAEKMEQS